MRVASARVEKLRSLYEVLKDQITPSFLLVSLVCPTVPYAGWVHSLFFLFFEENIFYVGFISLKKKIELLVVIRLIISHIKIIL